ncbi:MAG: LPS assembly lipoprotein LptE [Pseudomonadota bacterium]
MNRRALLSSSTVLAASAALAACGFQLRQPPKMAFSTVSLSGFAGNSPMATELARALEDSGVSVIDAALPAAAAASAASGAAQGWLGSHITLQALNDKSNQVAVSTTAYSQVRDLSIRTFFKFQVLRGDGSVLIPPTELNLARDIAYNEKDALAKQQEAASLHRAMQTDIVAQILRRLSTIRAGQLSAPVSAPAGMRP